MDVDTKPVEAKCSECEKPILVGYWWRGHLELLKKIKHKCLKCDPAGGATLVPVLVESK